MGQYHDARQNLKTLLEERLRRDVQTRANTSDAALNSYVTTTANQLLDNFEKFVVEHSNADFWRGVRQSFYGSFLFALFIGGIYIFVLGTQIGFKEVFVAILNGENPAHVEKVNRN